MDGKAEAVTPTTLPQATVNQLLGVSHHENLLLLVVAVVVSLVLLLVVYARWMLK